MTDQIKLNTQRIIPHKPVSEDKFGGAHKKIASALETIITNPEQEGVAIGLEGARGGGKSTILKILQKNIKKKINQDGKIAFINIDAWSHGGDQLRRACLELIVEGLLKKGWIEREEWQHKFLADGPRNSHSKYGVWSITVVLTVAFWILIPEPAEIALLKPFTPLPHVLIPEWFTIPVFIIVIAMFIHFLGKEFRNWILSLFRIFFSFEPSTQIDKATHQAEESSWLFQKWFRKVAGQALKKPERRLVIILDNLDRLEREKASSAIQTLQVFLDELIEHGEGNDWSCRVFFICCYSRTAISNDLKLTVNDHFEKLFNVQFRTPVPSPKMWIDYAKGVFTERGFEKPNIEEFIKLLQQSHRENTPTLRELEVCANELVALKKQNSAKNVPDINLLKYWLWAKDKADIMGALVEWHFPENHDGQEEKVPRNVNEAREYIGYYLGLPETEAYQALLSRPIQDEFRKRSGLEKLEILSENTDRYEEVFSAEIEFFLGQYCPADWILETIDLLYNCENPLEAHESCFALIKRKFPLNGIKLIYDEPKMESFVRGLKFAISRMDEIENISEILDFQTPFSFKGKNQKANADCWFWFHKQLLELLPTNLLSDHKFVLMGDDGQSFDVLRRVKGLWMDNRELGTRFAKAIRYEPEMIEADIEQIRERFDYYWFLWVNGRYDETLIKKVLEAESLPWRFDILKHRNEQTELGGVIRDYYKINFSKRPLSWIMLWDIDPETRVGIVNQGKKSGLETAPKIIRPRTKTNNFPFSGKGVEHAELQQFLDLENNLEDFDVEEILRDVASKNPVQEEVLSLWRSDYLKYKNNDSEPR